MELEAALRALSVFEILGNLHCYNEDTCSPDMRELFLQMLFAELESCSVSAAGALPWLVCITGNNETHLECPSRAGSAWERWSGNGALQVPIMHLPVRSKQCSLNQSL